MENSIIEGRGWWWKVSGKWTLWLEKGEGRVVWCKHELKINEFDQMIKQLLCFASYHHFCCCWKAPRLVGSLCANFSVFSSDVFVTSFKWKIFWLLLAWWWWSVGSLSRFARILMFCRNYEATRFGSASKTHQMKKAFFIFFPTLLFHLIHFILSVCAPRPLTECKAGEKCVSRDDMNYVK